MNVCAVSAWESPSPQTSSASDILSFLREATAELVVLPGVSRSRNTPSPEEVKRVIRLGVAVFVEHRGPKGETTPYLVTCDGPPKPMPRQIFSKAPTAECMAALVEKWPSRTFRIGSRTVTFAICGEINGFNSDGHVKHGRVLPFDILANPAHTVMGRWQHLGPKLSALSKGRVVIHVANDNRKNPEPLKTDVRIYINENFQEAEVQADRRLKLKWCQCEI